ncbi:hypothetical protein H1R20_g16366, partial [Candolleomyces eurysporus]
MASLFSPVKVGNVHLEHRVVLAPLTRMRASSGDHVPLPSMVKEYYSQRSLVPGTLLITEATFIAREAGGMPLVPGIWSSEQIQAWKEITSAVHANRSFIFLQLWALGRTARPDLLAKEGGYECVAPSSIPLSDRSADTPAPRSLTVAEIDKYVELYAQAARNAVDAGFDGVEVHGANGYLVDQFLQDVSNTRTDEYGGSIENRSRFGLRVMDAIANAIGEERTAIRLSPWARYQDMKMKEPVPQFSHFVSTLASSHPNLAYLHVTEAPPVEERLDVKDLAEIPEESNDFLRKIWSPRPFISCAGYTRQTALDVSKSKGDLIAFGRPFISNPDLPFRLKHDIPLAKYYELTFYITSDNPGSEKGYIDYPFSAEFLKVQNSKREIEH